MEAQMELPDVEESRTRLLQELENAGINVDALSALPVETLQDVVASLRRQRSGNSRGGAVKVVATHRLSEIDKKMLKHLLDSQGYVSSFALAKTLDLPITTVSRRRKRLEADWIKQNYSLNLEKFGWRMASLFVTTNGQATIVGKEILDMSDVVVAVTRMLGESALNLKVDVIFRTNKELLGLIERIKSRPDVSNILWSESVESIGGNDYRQIIEA